ncbi:PREDICTED: la-related protein 6C-like [Ipomoea nil]|uniref:la-related protein 6C-like n=1 Tax=Ipomoea nil TaxID=35883 RepID=UPI000901DDB9|nr:PREDICTED: la-related protein 6C-like [Ipomoea nil]
MGSTQIQRCITIYNIQENTKNRSSLLETYPPRKQSKKKLFYQSIRFYLKNKLTNFISMAQLQPGERDNVSAAVAASSNAHQDKSKDVMIGAVNGEAKNKWGSSGTSSSTTASGAAANNNNFKLNVQAPEFVPRSITQMPVSGYFYPYFQYQDWIYVGDQDPTPFYSNNQNLSPPQTQQKNSLPDEVKQKIIKQVEYQLSDMSLLANENLAKQMSKDPEGYVPISAVASTKKIKSLLSSNTTQVLAQALQSSTKLIVSSDGKKVKRKQPFTEKDKEELQSRTVVAENLPDDHSHHNIEKIFNVVGSVKTIRICHPQDPNSSRSKGEYFISNKLHALIEFESPEIADKAVEKLNDERNWRKGLRVKLLLRRSPRSVLKTRKSEFEGCLEDDDQAPPVESAPEDSVSSPLHQLESTETNVEESSGGGAAKKGWGKGRGKTRLRTQIHGGRGLLAASPQCSSSSSSASGQSESPMKQASKGPRMPDGTRGFTMGRGKPLNTTAAPPSSVPCI